MTSGENDDQPGRSVDSSSDKADDGSPTEDNEAEVNSTDESTEASEENADAGDSERSDESETTEDSETTDNASVDENSDTEAETESESESDSETVDDSKTEDDSGREDDKDESETDSDEESEADGDEKSEADESSSETDGGTVEEETGGMLEGAPDDQEMPLTSHIEEMIKRLLAVIVVMGGVSLIVFPVSAEIANHLWYSYLPAPSGGITECVGDPEDGACPRVYHPLGLLITRLKIASLAGLILALPVFVYQTYLFMRPGLYPQERRYYLASVPTSLVLALVGVAFAYFLILPFIFEYFMFYSAGVVEEEGIAFGLVETFDLILLMMGLFALIFQIPLFMMLAIMMGITTRLWLEDKRIIFWVVFAGTAFLFSPDPTGMAPLMVALTMIGLFEITLLLLRWTGR